MEKFKNYISLGFFCSVALELERIGLRSCSSPFDWCISEWEGVENAIQNKFESFLEYENLYQNKKHPEIYLDKKYKMTFFHEFNGYEKLEKQIMQVKEKYQRRIKRFYENIKEPTLFIRYILDEEEKEYLEKNYDKIIKMLKAFNSNNEIMFIANEDIKSDTLTIYLVEKDKKDNVARKPFEKNIQLQNFFNSIEYDKRKENIARYKEKQKEKNSICGWIKKIIKKANKLLRKKYIHNKVY